MSSGRERKATCPVVGHASSGREVKAGRPLARKGHDGDTLGMSIMPTPGVSLKPRGEEAEIAGPPS